MCLQHVLHSILADHMFPILVSPRGWPEEISAPACLRRGESPAPVFSCGFRGLVSHTGTGPVVQI